MESDNLSLISQLADRNYIQSIVLKEKYMDFFSFTSGPDLDAEILNVEVML